eukprot:g40819.t1
MIGGTEYAVMLSLTFPSISFCSLEYYFSPSNLRQGKFLKTQLAQNSGCCPLDTLLTSSRVRDVAGLWAAARARQRGAQRRPGDGWPARVPERVAELGFGQWLSYGEHNVTYTAVDPSGNWAACTRRLFVRNLQAPSLSCGANGHLDPVPAGNASSSYLVGMDPGLCGVRPTTADGFGVNYTSSDVQGPVQVVVDCTGDGEARRRLAQLGLGVGSGGGALSLAVQCVAVATDQAGHHASCIVSYYAQDREAPVVHCQPACTVQLRTVAGFAGCFAAPTDNCAYNDTSYAPDPAAIAWLSFADSPFTLYSTGSDNSPYSPVSATCETVVTLSGYCGDGLLDFYGAHGPAES